MRIFRKRPFYWGTKKVTRYLRWKITGKEGKDKKNYLGELRNALLIYNALCEIESDFSDKPIRNYAKMIETYSGIERHIIPAIIEKFEQFGIVRIFGQDNGKGKFPSRSLIMNDEITDGDFPANGEENQNMTLFKSTDGKVSAGGKLTNYKKISNKNINLSADKSAPNHKIDHQKIVDGWWELMQKLRGFKKDKLKLTPADHGRLKQVLAKEAVSVYQLQITMMYFLGSWQYKEFAPTMKTWLSDGVLKGIINRMINKPTDFWKDIEQIQTKLGSTRRVEEGKVSDMAKKLQILRERLANKTAVHMDPIERDEELVEESRIERASRS